MQPVEGLCPGAGDLITAVTQHPQHHQFRIGAEFPQSLVAQRDHHNRVRVRGISLTALAGVEDACPGGQLGGHIQHALSIGQEPLRYRAPDPVSSLNGPDPLRPLTRDFQQLAIAAGLGAEPARCPQDLPVVPSLDSD